MGRLRESTSSTAPCSMRCVGIVFSTGTLRSVCGGQQIVSAHGTTLANKQIRCISIPVLEGSFGDERRPVKTLSPPLFQDLSFHCYPLFNRLINLREKIGYHATSLRNTVVENTYSFFLLVLV